MFDPSATMWPPSSEELPAYAPPRQGQVSSTSLSQKIKGVSQPWLTLNARSAHTASSTSQVMPLYKKAGGTISGDIALLLDKPDAIQAIRVSLRGISSFAGSESTSTEGSIHTLAYKYVFLEVTQTLWSSSEGNPQHAEPSPWGSPQNGKLQGKYSFPFSFQLPLELSSDSTLPQDSSPTYPLPASLYDKKTPAAIDYELSVTLVRGALKANTLLNLNFIYAPRTKPGPPSDLRKSAYTNGFLALDPLGDPLGWQNVAPSPKVKGKLVNGRVVEVDCTFALATPLTYSRGSFIPFSLSIQSADMQALQLLYSPAAVSIVLLQRIITGKNAHVKKAKVGRDVHLSPVARAVCWPATNSTRGWEDGRILMGEIPLPKKLPPSTITPRVILQYAVVMFPFEATGFIPADPYSFVVDQSVDIATHNADGPSPCSQMPPGYENPRKDLTDRFQQMLNAMSRFR